MACQKTELPLEMLARSYGLGADAALAGKAPDCGGACSSCPIGSSDAFRFNGLGDSFASSADEVKVFHSLFEEVKGASAERWEAESNRWAELLGFFLKNLVDVSTVVLSLRNHPYDSNCPEGAAVSEAIQLCFPLYLNLIESVSIMGEQFASAE